jgi:tetratricopeptide (TPR) repeat protein
VLDEIFMRALRRICLLPAVLLFAIPAVSQTDQNPKTAISSLVSDVSVGERSSAAEIGHLDSGPEYLGNQLMEQRQYQAALEAYHQVPARSAKLWSRMGVAYQLLLDFNDAARCYAESVQLDPGNALYYNDLATAYDQLGDHRRAEDLYRMAIRLDPHSAIYLKNLGTNLLAQHEFDRGSEAYHAALAIDPHILDFRNSPTMALPRKDNAETNYVKARSCAQAGLIDCTVVYLRKALDEGSATPKRIIADDRFQAVLSVPQVQQLLIEQR